MDEFLLSGKNILVTDDEDDLREIISSELKYFGANVFESCNVKEAKKILDANNMDLVISDIRMPGESGLHLLQDIKKRKSTLPVILITGYADFELDEVYDQGVDLLISKPFNVAYLLFQVERLLQDLPDRISKNHDLLKKEKRVHHLKLAKNSSLECLEYSLARGGISLRIKFHESLVFKKGDLLSFEIDLDETTLSGEGFCRWIKSAEKKHEYLMGLEFINLQKQSLEYFSLWSKKNSSIEFIKAIKT